MRKLPSYTAYFSTSPGKSMNSFLPISRILRRSNTILRPLHTCPRKMATITNGDLNNTAAERVRKEISGDIVYRNASLAIPTSEDDPSVRTAYRPFLLNDAAPEQDWIAGLELSTVLKMVDLQVLKSGGDRLKVLVLHGSMRKR